MNIQMLRILGAPAIRRPKREAENKKQKPNIDQREYTLQGISINITSFLEIEDLSDENIKDIISLDVGETKKLKGDVFDKELKRTK